MKWLFAGSCPKNFEEPAPNEDQFGFSANGERCAVCDGASESYNSRLWASVLCQRYLDDPAVGPEWLALAREQYLAGTDMEAMSWSQSAAFERGSFSTLLGVERGLGGTGARVLAIGDSAALLVDDGRLVEAWPFADPERFKERPTLLSTNGALNGFLLEEGFTERHTRFLDLRGLRSPMLLCMTDALAEWALRTALLGDGGLVELAAISDEQGLRDLVAREREARRMRVDDSTLITFSMGGNADGVPHP